MKFASNKLDSTRLTTRNFFGLTILQELSKPLNSYLVIMMLLQMVPFVSVTDGEPTLVLALIPLLLVSIILEVWQDSKRSI